MIFFYSRLSAWLCPWSSTLLPPAAAPPPVPRRRLSSSSQESIRRRCLSSSSSNNSIGSSSTSRDQTAAWALWCSRSPCNSISTTSTTGSSSSSFLIRNSITTTSLSSYRTLSTACCNNSSRWQPWGFSSSSNSNSRTPLRTWQTISNIRIININRNKFKPLFQLLQQCCKNAGACRENLFLFECFRCILAGQFSQSFLRQFQRQLNYAMSMKSIQRRIPGSVHTCNTALGSIASRNYFYNVGAIKSQPPKKLLSYQN